MDSRPCIDPPIANPGTTYMCCGETKGDPHKPWCMCNYGKKAA